MKITLSGFLGENRAVQPILLPENVGTWLRRFSSFGGRLLSNRPFCIPPRFYTSLNSLELKAKFFNPIYKWFCFAKSSYKSISPSIPVLLGLTRPSAILWGVVPIIVDSVKRTSFWSFSHICDKVCEPINSVPSFTNAYPPTAIVFELAESRVIAPMPHLCPSGIKRVMFSTPNKTISSNCFDIHFSTKASAGHGVTTAKSMGVNGSYCSALANASPLNRPIAFNAILELDRKPSKNFSGKVNKCPHICALLEKIGAILSCKSHVVAINNLSVGAA